MRRKTFDALLTTGGLVLAAILIVAGILLTWASSFINNQVHSQLAAQKITFPAANSQAISSPEIKPYLTKYAGQQLVTGEQAKAFANHYIAVHLQEIGGGQTYSQLSAKAQANPKDTALANTVNTMFKGETLRGMLLNAYAFGKMASIAGIAATVSFIGAGVMLLLSVLGFVHLRRTDPAVEVLPKLGAKLGAQSPAPVEP